MKPTTIASLQKCKQDKKRFATITAYDYSFAKLFAEEGLNVMRQTAFCGLTCHLWRMPRRNKPLKTPQR